MRFSAIIVTCVAFAAQVTPTYGSRSSDKLSCQNEVEGCLEIVILDTDQCNEGTVTYCLQRVENYPSSCPGSYDYMHVYVDGAGVDLLSATSPLAYCTGTSATTDDCTFYDSGDSDSCSRLDHFTHFGLNVGLKCKDDPEAICVQVPIDPAGIHAEIIFGVKDQDGCEESTNDWGCSGTGNDSCACHKWKNACIWKGEDLTSCIPTAPGTGCQPDPGGGGCNGDPHFKTWRGHHFDFHGECDLVLLHSSDFGAGLGLDVHIRTKLRRDMSYISAAVLRMGTDVLEVESQGVYYLNGVAGAELPDEFSGFAFLHTQPTNKQHVFEVYMGGRERVKLKTYKDFVSVLIEQGQSKNFGDCVGLMGDFGNGRMLARDGNTVLDDPNAFGQEWQVLDTEPTFFQTLRLPRHPTGCKMPPPKQASQLRRRLLESSPVKELAAEEACAHWGEGKDNCVFDILTTGDLEMAVAGSY
jgi:hypothetical protein